MLIKPLVILALSATVALAQPPEDRDANQDPAARIKEKTKHIDLSDPESLRMRLTRTLNFAQRIVEKHEAALKQLDAGVSPREVMRSLRTPEDRKNFNQIRESQKSENARPNATPKHTERMTSESMASESSFQDDRSDNRPPPFSETVREEDLVRVRDFIELHLPEVHSKLKQVESLSPPAAEQLVTLLSHKVLEILSLEQVDPTLSDLKLRELKAGLRYTEASRDYRMLLRQPANDRAELTKAEDRVRQAASDRFDAQVQIKQYEIHRLTMRIQELHDALDELNEERDQQVDAQVESAKSSRKGRRSNGRSGNQIDH